MELYIIRHGQSSNNASSDIKIRSNDPSLTDLGKAQADKLAEWLAQGDIRLPWTDPDTGFTRNDAVPSFKFDYLYCSAMYRAMQTAYPISQALDIQPEIWIDIHEHGGIYLEEAGKFVGYPGKTRSEVLGEFPQYVLPDHLTETGWWREDGHEERGAFYGRAIRVAGELRRRAHDPQYKGKRIGIVTHGTFIDALLKAFFNMLPSRQMYFMHYNTAMTRLDFRTDDVVLTRCINRVDHLPSELIS